MSIAERAPRPTDERGQRAHRAAALLAQAAPLSGAAGLAPEVQTFFRVVNHLNEVYVRWPQLLHELPDPEVRSFLSEQRQELDYYLRTEPQETLLEALDGAVAADPRVALLAAELTALLERLRQRADQELRRRGVQRMQVSPGTPTGREVLPSDEPAAPTTQAHLDGRVAAVRPGNGGYWLHGELVVPARAQLYRFCAELAVAD
ncbi:MAG: hypothetical protein IT204_09175 [Fimbriimonadaceae bacterium]|nr:hypothetical protein [Fimbriimonadaceae bacterium]